MTSRHAETARRYWETYLPSATAELDDPTAYFEDLGRQVELQIEAALLTPPTVDEEATPREKEATFQATARAAEESALQDLVFLPPEPGTEQKRLVGWTPPGWETETATETPTAP